ncbi:hypothetical protein HMF8227_01375 [Saliniradius amylolyticus]|uniref:TIGR03503 family protein n=1 Tax=Saliniradius amylolyticus TaxID=2183582 RepID=A0A2S2E2I8_9ALTE|nr:TIGR03503 family protein [Saliniradius amylolyticus]AWL11853.1 hypothetical protein HMF8227_01375 [Saliniradius amylolyticus]
MTKHLWALAGVLLSLTVWAQQGEEEQSESDKANPITMLGNEYLNSIELLNNRFRIDYKVDEVTMVFFREYGSAPVVLVRPDGSKIFASDEDVEMAGEPGADKIRWFDDVNYDLIRIKEPMPGPWQAIGAIKPNSRIMVISDLKLEVEPFPETLFKGEVLKVIATLSNDGEPIDEVGFRDVVELEVELVSTNDAEYDNFGAGTVTLATFKDDGRGMDERPADGLFTGQFNLRINSGKWTPVYRVKSELFNREHRGEPVHLLPNPFELSVELDKGDGRHHLFIDATHPKIDMESVLIDGKVRYPNGDVQNFSLTETGPGPREFEIFNYEYGMFRAKVTAFGNTTSGRDFIMDVPEFSFLAEEQAVKQQQAMAEQPQDDNQAEAGTSGEASLSEAQEASNIAGNLDGMAMPQSFAPAPEEQAEQGMSGQMLLIIIIAANVLIVLTGGGMIWYFQRPRSKTDPEHEELLDTETQSSPKTTKGKDDGLLDLSMPDED